MDVICLSSDSENSTPFGESENTDQISTPIGAENNCYEIDWNNEIYPIYDFDHHCTTEKAKEIEQEEVDNDVTIIEPEAVDKYENYKSPSKRTTNISSYDIEKYNSDDYMSTRCGQDKVKCNSLSSQKSSKSPVKKKTKRTVLSQEDKDYEFALKEQKKLERERVREEKKLEQERQKAFKAILAKNQRSLKPEENIKFLKVHIDNEVVNSLYGGNLISVLQQNSIQYTVEAQPKSCTITWSKKRVEREVSDFGNVIENIICKDEDQLLYVLGWEKAVNLVCSNDLLSHVETVRTSYVDKKITLIIYGLEKYFDFKKRRRKQEESGKFGKTTQSEMAYENAPKITRDQLEFAVIDLQLLGKYNCRLLETPEELSMFVHNITKSLSQLDYKMDKMKRQEDDSEWFEKDDSSHSVKVDKKGNGLIKLWQQQLCQFSNAGVETAQAIASQFNSPSALVNRYNQCENRKEGELLLQNLQIRREAGILSSSRRIGPELSKKIYKFFNSDDPNEEL